MRISDLSSDVCSSDLTDERLPFAALAEADLQPKKWPPATPCPCIQNTLGLAQIRAPQETSCLTTSYSESATLPRAKRSSSRNSSRLVSVSSGREIGRASCRGRVGRYV